MKINFGKVLKELRLKNGVTQEKLAMALGVTPQAVSRWEAGGGYPDFELIPQISAVLKTTPDKLFCMDVDEQKKKEYLDKLVVRVVNLDLKDVVAEYRTAHEMYPDDMMVTFFLGKYIADYITKNKEILTDEDKNRLFSEAEILLLRVMERCQDNQWKNTAKAYLMHRLYIDFDREKAVEMAKQEQNLFGVLPLLTPEERVYFSNEQLPLTLMQFTSFLLGSKYPNLDYRDNKFRPGIEDVKLRKAIYDAVYNYLGADFTARKLSDMGYRSLFSGIYLNSEDDTEALAALEKYVELSKNIEKELREFGKHASSMLLFCRVFSPCPHTEKMRKDIFNGSMDFLQTVGKILSTLLLKENDENIARAEYFKESKRFQSLITELEKIDFDIVGITDDWIKK
ncbi:MAG: hypothetical protein DBX47_04475 [Clostridiales bacterium]|nr:MAG: hypothetical protein DBX47_04475 [Clostridiales bacterium]